MKNNTLLDEEKQKVLMTKKMKLVDQTIKQESVSKYQVIQMLPEGLLTRTEDLKKCLFENLEVTEEAKEKAEKISKIAFQLQSCVDLEKGGELAENLIWCYRFIRYGAKRIQDNECMNYVKPTHKVIQDLNEAWNGIPEDQRDKSPA